MMNVLLKALGEKDNKSGRLVTGLIKFATVGAANYLSGGLAASVLTKTDTEEKEID